MQTVFFLLRFRDCRFSRPNPVCSILQYTSTLFHVDFQDDRCFFPTWQFFRVITFENSKLYDQSIIQQRINIPNSFIVLIPLSSVGDELTQMSNSRVNSFSVSYEFEPMNSFHGL